jgi:hypothetical protein
VTLVLLIAAVLLTLVAAFHLVRPFFADRREQLRFEVLDEDLRRVEELVVRKSTLLQELRDITLDRETGKIAEEDFEDLKKHYERQAVAVMRELDELHGGRGWEAAIDEQLSERLDMMARRREAGRPQQSEAGQEADSIDCHACGKQMEAQARFCSHCGATLAEASAAGDEDASAAQMDSRSMPTSGSKVAT